MTDMWPYESVLVIVAHPDDEVLWAGGTILMHPQTKWTVVALCRRHDPDRAPKFRRVLTRLGATGDMGDLDDGPEQIPLHDSVVRDAVLDLVGSQQYDLILTHSMAGEYTRHRRHEEIGKAVLDLWDAGHLHSRDVWTFAYRSDGASGRVEAMEDADSITVLPAAIWEQKRLLITRDYGFQPTSFEAHAALREEAFWWSRKQASNVESIPQSEVYRR